VAAPLGIKVEDAAIGIVQLLEQNLLHAVEEISVKRGFDPRRFTLIAAGGAGPMHGATVGRALGCRRVYVPRHAGAFCALGMLDSDIRQDFVRMYDAPLTEEGLAGVVPVLATMRETALRELEGASDAGRRDLEVGLDLIYKGQARSVHVRFAPGKDDIAAVKSRFEAEHLRMYGHIKSITPIRISAARLVASAAAVPLAAPRYPAAKSSAKPYATRRIFLDRQAEWAQVPIYRGADLGPGHELRGPLIVEEQTTTLYAGPGDIVSVDPAGNYVIDLR
jgi:N-methylhydantoinase A